MLADGMGEGEESTEFQVGPESIAGKMLIIERLGLCAVSGKMGGAGQTQQSGGIDEV